MMHKLNNIKSKYKTRIAIIGFILLFAFRNYANCQVNVTNIKIKIKDTSGSISHGFCGWPSMRARWSEIYADSSYYPVPKVKYSPSMFADSTEFSKRRSVAEEILQNMVYLPAGSFWQGCTLEEDIECDHRAFAEKPLHKKDVTGFFMGSTEITQRQWRKVMGYNPSLNKGCDDCPVESISWNEVQGFLGILNACTGLRFRLPTESEWEYAAKIADSTSTWKKGDTSALKNIGWYYVNSEGKTHPVGTKEQSCTGLYDMHGNVREWCSDLYGLYPKKKKEFIPMESGWRSLRGGSYSDEFRKCRSSYRFYQHPGEKSEFVGFRIILN
jgi:formylglycine-generating enzyme required for sulfatase activity